MTPSMNPQYLREVRSAATLEIRTVVEEAKESIKQFYDVYDQKIKSQMTHPLFRGIDEN